MEQIRQKSAKAELRVPHSKCTDGESAPEWPLQAGEMRKLKKTWVSKALGSRKDRGREGDPRRVSRGLRKIWCVAGQPRKDPKALYGIPRPIPGSGSTALRSNSSVNPARSLPPTDMGMLSRNLLTEELSPAIIGAYTPRRRHPSEDPKCSANSALWPFTGRPWPWPTA